MESTRQHLLRVSDIIGEIETRLRSLRLQAQKAERYKRYKAELKDIELWSAAQRYLGHLAEEKSLGAEHGACCAGQHDIGDRARASRRPRSRPSACRSPRRWPSWAPPKDDLFALSNKAQLGMQRAQHQDDEAGAADGARRGGAARDRRADGARRRTVGGHRGARRAAGAPG